MDPRTSEGFVFQLSFFGSFQILLAVKDRKGGEGAVFRLKVDSDRQN